MLTTDIGIDLGTASILVFVRGKGVVLKEPSVVAFDRDSGKIRAIGEEARLMIGRTPENIVAVRPLKEGVISDYRVTEKMLKYFNPWLRGTSLTISTGNSYEIKIPTGDFAKTHGKMRSL